VKNENKKNSQPSKGIDALDTLVVGDESLLNRVHDIPLRVGLSPCGCDICRALGDASTHNRPEHDTLTDQTLHFQGRSLRLIGGTTRAARVLAQMLEGRHDISGSRIVELGAGVGLIAQCLVILGCQVWCTDQLPVLDLLRENLQRNLSEVELSRSHVMPLYWGDEVDIAELERATFTNIDLVIGSDLIFAHENNSDLFATLKHLCCYVIHQKIFIGRRVFCIDGQLFYRGIMCALRRR
jgi:Lysine methyltransferase